MRVSIIDTSLQVAGLDNAACDILPVRDSILTARIDTQHLVGVQQLGLQREGCGRTKYTSIIPWAIGRRINIVW